MLGKSESQSTVRNRSKLRETGYRSTLKGQTKFTLDADYSRATRSPSGIKTTSHAQLVQRGNGIVFPSINQKPELPTPKRKIQGLTLNLEKIRLAGGGCDTPTNDSLLGGMPHSNSHRDLPKGAGLPFSQNIQSSIYGGALHTTAATSNNTTAQVQEESRLKHDSSFGGQKRSLRKSFSQ